MKQRKWVQVNSRTAFETPFFRVRQDRCRLPDGAEIDDYYVIEEPDIGMVFALTPARELVLVEQYKHGIGAVCLELPAGMLEQDAPDRDTARAEAQREFHEETGYDAAEYHHIASFVHNPSRMNNHIHLFAAVDVHPVGGQQLDPNEDIAVRLVPLAEIDALILSGAVRAVDTIAGIYMARAALRARGLL